MFKRCKFIFALMVCLCVFAYDTVSISDDLRGKSFAWAAEIAITEENFSDENFRKALLLATGKEATATDGTITNAEKIITLTLADGTITATVSEGESPFSTPADEDKKTALQNAIAAIMNISGINNFTALTQLNVSGCTQLTAIEVQTLTNLTTLNASGCASLKVIDVTTLSKLTSLAYHCNTIITGDFPKVYAKQLILDGSINMTFYVEIDDTTLNDTSKTKSAAFTIGSAKTFSGTFSKDVYMDADSKKYYAFIGAVTSVQMADSITAEIKVGDKTVTFAGYTVKDYLDTLTEEGSTYSEATQTLANALKDYGHYAQVTLNETNTNYAAGNHKAMDANNDSLGTTVTDDLSGYAFTNGTGSTISYTLDLDSNTVLHVILPAGSYVHNDAAKTEHDTSLITVDSERTYEMTAVKAWTNEDDKNNVYVSFSDISAHELADAFTIPVNQRHSKHNKDFALVLR